MLKPGPHRKRWALTGGPEFVIGFALSEPGHFVYPEQATAPHFQ